MAEMKFIGTDSWDRPVYEDPEGNLWKDVDPRRGSAASLHSALNNEFDGEPDCPYHGDIIFNPGRVVWSSGKRYRYELE